MRTRNGGKTRSTKTHKRHEECQSFVFLRVISGIEVELSAVDRYIRCGRKTMSVNVTAAKDATAPAVSSPPVPKRITNAQTVCNERNEKNKLCNGHLKQLKTAGEPAEIHLRGDDVLFKCQICGTLYMGPPLGHVRDPEKQRRFVEAELSALLQAAGGTLPVIKKNERGVFVIVEAEGSGHGHGAPAAAKPAPAA